VYGNVVQLAFTFAAKIELFTLNKNKAMKEQVTIPQAKRLTIHYFASEYIQGQRRFVRRPLTA